MSEPVASAADLDPSRLKGLILSSGWRPYPYFHPDLERMIEYSIEEIQGTKNEVDLFRCGGGSDYDGLFGLRRQGWDSRQLGFGCGRLEPLLLRGDAKLQYSHGRYLLQVADSWCAEKGVSLLSCKIESGSLGLVQALEEIGMRTVGCELTWVWPDGRLGCQGKGLSEVSIDVVDCLEPQDIPDFGSLFTADRFHADFRIERVRSDRLWSESIRNALTTRSDQIVVAREGSSILGFVTCDLDRNAASFLGRPVCNLFLVAVAVAAQGRGIGKALVSRALEWANSVHCLVQVQTQSINYAANATYQSLGFKLAHSQFILHGWY